MADFTGLLPTCRIKTNAGDQWKVKYQLSVPFYINGSHKVWKHDTILLFFLQIHIKIFCVIFYINFTDRIPLITCFFWSMLKIKL